MVTPAGRSTNSGVLWPASIWQVELASESETVTPPAFLSIVRDVTDDPGYKNKSLATRGRPPS
jgi:CYTH domain-containing protein